MTRTAGTTGRARGSTRPIRGAIGLSPGAMAGRLLVVAAITGLGWLIGLDLANASAIGLVVVAIYSLRALVGGEPEGWPAEPESARNEGTRREVARLSWGMQGSDDRVDRWSAQRLHGLAARRMAEHGLDLDSSDDAAECRRLLGATTFDALSLDPNRLPRYAQFVAALDVVERLTPEETPR
ncbi:hypothetical protein [Microlunatus ginsengisoli]|uniref:DUF4129 domain-containing protein n=1 Tax=Microlunatus ginsengisoli TaxID=363863 RepID=A0ABP6ZGI5_9ACTN